ncbi:MAG TPA: hypothetical protein VGK52_11635 [Polyangia bacterium]
MSGSRPAFGAVALVALGFLEATAGARTGPDVAARPGASALVERRDGVDVDWAAGTVTASGGAAADLHMPSAEVARPGAVRRAESRARERLGRALAALPLGGERKLGTAAVALAVGHARTTGTEYQSNGGALVRVTVRFVDWIDPPPAADAPTSVTLAVPAMRLGARPLAKLGEGECALGAAVYRLGPPPAGIEAVPARIDHAGRLVIEAKHGAASAQKLAGGAALIYVGKVLK